MDELEISGKRYISAKRAAKEHKYHSDYIGQLVRGGKVEGQKVGRAWYVHAESLTSYLNKETPPASVGQPYTAPAHVEVQKAAVAETTAAEIYDELPRVEYTRVQTVETVQEEVETAPEDAGYAPEVPFVEEDAEEVEEEKGNTIAIHKQASSITTVFPVRKVGGLTYVDDAEPMIPQTRKSIPASAHKVTQRQEPVAQTPILARNAPATRDNNIVVKAVSLVLIGVVIFSVTLGMSYILKSLSTLSDGHAEASVILGGN
jgi:hypothetical protein